MMTARSRVLRGRHGLVAAAVLLLATSCSKPTADDHLKKATDYAAQSRMDEAILEYRLALEVDPKRGDIHTKLADAYMEKRDLANAYREYIRAADTLPNDDAAQVKAGNFLLLGKNFEDAKTRATKVLDRDPKNVDATILLGNALAGLQDMDGALAQFQEAAALNPTEDRAFESVGAVQAMRGQKKEAEASFRKAIDVAPKSVQARMALANFLWNDNRQAEAESTLKAALQLDPANAVANRSLGMFYLATNRLTEAEPYFQAIAKNSERPEDQLSLADFYVIAKRNDDARRILKDIATKDKFFAVATTRLAAIDTIEGQRASAHEKLKQVIDKYPKDMAARLLNARVLLLDGKPEDALAQANAIVTEEPTSPQAGATYMLIGAVQTSLDRYDEAIKAYEEVLRRVTQPLPAQIALSALYLKTRNFDKAMTAVQSAEVIQPKNPIARALTVRILLAQGKNSEAKIELASLQKDYPNAVPVLTLTGAQQLTERQFDAARATFTKALQLAPNNLEAAAGLVTVDLASGRKADAVARMEAGLKAGTPTSDMLVLAARTYAASGDMAKAEEYLNKAVEAEPARLEAYMLLGQLYASQKRLPEATEQFQKIVQKSPKSVGANTILGTLYEAQRRPAEAEQQYQKVLQIDSRAAVAANNLAWLYVSSNRNLDEALQLAQTAWQQLPDEPHVADTLGWIYYRKDMAPQAITYLEGAVKRLPDDPSGFYHLGMAYVRTGDIEKGRTALQHALASKVEFDGVAEARKTLAQIGGL